MFKPLFLLSGLFEYFQNGLFHFLDLHIDPVYNLPETFPRILL